MEANSSSPLSLRPFSTGNTQYLDGSIGTREPKSESRHFFAENKFSLICCDWCGSGMGIIQRMGMVATGKDDKPKHPITIHKARPYRGVPPEEEMTTQNNLMAITAG